MVVAGSSRRTAAVGRHRLAGATVEDLDAVDGVGPTLAHAVVDWFSIGRNRAVVDKLRAAGLRFAEEGSSASPDSDRPLEGSTFVVTGTLPTYSREQVTDLIKRAGGKVTGSVSARTSYLVAGEDPGGKLDKAKKLGVAIIDESELRRLLGGGADS